MARLAQVRTPEPAFDVDEALAAWGELGDPLGWEHLGQDFDALLHDERGLPR